MVWGWEKNWSEKFPKTFLSKNTRTDSKEKMIKFSKISCWVIGTDIYWIDIYPKILSYNLGFRSFVSLLFSKPWLKSAKIVIISKLFKLQQSKKFHAAISRLVERAYIKKKVRYKARGSPPPARSRGPPGRAGCGCPTPTARCTSWPGGGRCRTAWIVSTPPNRRVQQNSLDLAGGHGGHGFAEHRRLVPLCRSRL